MINPRRKEGFTLIEILIVIAIVSLVVTLSLPAIQRVTLQKVASTTRKFVGLIRSVRNDAILLNSIHRIGFDLQKKTWWVESQQQFQLLIQPPTEEEIQKAKKKKKTKKKKEEEETSQGDRNFALSDKYSKLPVPLPAGVEIAGILKEEEGLIQEGRVYIHFFPNGFNDQAIIYLKKEGGETVSYSIVLRPNSGRVEIKSEEVKTFD